MATKTTTAKRDKGPKYIGIPGSSQGGEGYVPTYTGPSGTVPVAPDPAVGETLTGKTSLHVWVELTHISD